MVEIIQHSNLSFVANIAVNEDIIRRVVEMTLAAEIVCHPDMYLQKAEGVRRKTENGSQNMGNGKRKTEGDWEVSIVLTDDEQIQQLNKQYRHVDSPTDVLAFAMREGIDADLNPHLLGDIVISVQTAHQQALDVGHSLDIELALLAVHGMLHLLGYDHEISDEATVMREKEETILRLL